MSGLVQITKSGLRVSASHEHLGELRDHFEWHHYTRLPEFLDTATLTFVQEAVERGEFYERSHPGIKSNKELCMKQNAAYGALLLFMNDERLFQIIERVTGCAPIGCFEGRVYRFAPGLGHHDAWHSDMAEDRLIALSVNLSPEPYSGGILQMRDAGSRKILSQVPNLGRGDAVLFRLSAQLQHRITRVSGAVSKTAFAGWFRAKPDFLSLLRGTTQRPELFETPFHTSANVFEHDAG